MQNIESVRRRRALKLKIFSIIITLISSAITLFWTYVYGVSLWLSLPFTLASSTLSLLGSSALFEKIFGVYAALKPVEGDRYNPLNYAQDLPPDARVAMLMPIYHEDPARVMAAVQAMIEDLEKHKADNQFDWFILSDSRKEDCIVQEEYCVFILRSRFPDINIFYRNRISNTFAKVGNTSDFFRRWGGHYKYSIVFDADSMVPARTLLDMSRTIEGNEKIGLIQSVNYDVNSHTLHGRYVAFKKNISERIGFAGEFFCKMGRCHNYGHNLILRNDAFIRHCALPVLPDKKLFPGGKPSSHDFFEAVLLEGAGYQTWTMPTLVAFEDQLHNLLDTTKRELRWIHGAMDWFRLWNSSRLSTFGKKDLLVSALNYFHAPIGLAFFLFAFWGTSYMLMHPLKTYLLIKHNQVMGVIGFMLLVVSLFVPFLLFCITFYKLKILKNVGGFWKFLFSYVLAIVIAAFTAPIDMILINLILFGWFKGKRMVWDAQNREGRILPWKECFDNLKYVMIFGLGILLFAMLDIYPYMNGKTFSLIHMSSAWIAFFIFPPAIGLAFSPVVARFMSKEFPAMEKMGWLQHPFERKEDEYFVVRRTRELTPLYKAHIEPVTFESSLGNHWFAVHHMASIPSRPHKFAFWKDLLKDKDISQCSRLERLTIFRCRELWDLFFTRALHKSRHPDT